MSTMAENVISNNLITLGYVGSESFISFIFNSFYNLKYSSVALLNSKTKIDIIRIMIIRYMNSIIFIPYKSFYNTHNHTLYLVY